MKVVPINRERSESLENLAGYIEENMDSWRAALVIYYDKETESVGFSMAGSATVLETVGWVELLKNQLLKTLGD